MPDWTDFCFRFQIGTESYESLLVKVDTIGFNTIRDFKTIGVTFGMSGYLPHIQVLSLRMAWYILFGCSN